MKQWQKIVSWIFILFIVYLIIELLRKIFGGSLEFEQLIIGLLIANLGYSFYINSKVSEHIGWHKGVQKRKIKTSKNGMNRNLKKSIQR